MTPKEAFTMLDEAAALVRSLGTCRVCDGVGRYCRCCGGGRCSCDRGGSYDPVRCDSCVGGLTASVAVFLARLAAMREGK